MSSGSVAPRVLLFDLGGVVMRIDFDRVFRHWAHLGGVPVASLRDRFSMDDTFARHERGEIDDAEFFAHLRRVLDLDLSDAHMLDGWNAIFDGEVPGMRDLLTEVSARLPTFALSNTNRAHVGFFTPMYADVLGSFREVFASSTLGLRKPEPECFHRVAASVEARLDEILFFDDSPANVHAARALGMQAVEVRGFGDVRAAIDALDLS